ncbi:SH3-domain-containing protein [Hesseltinella vesiculosa]|uniref:SH3-domain-containing protein n=1 Tax=Hesseltinella vesiculosa TaxID=101127 RepID=A0A1X2GUJ7_9FUNG|nr:SH3-domain-containing protein [Hesseltinella vesiculosa]
MSTVQHIVDSVKRDLAFLKEQQRLSPQAYDDMLHLLDSQNLPSPASHFSAPSAPPPPSYPSNDSVEAIYDFNGANANDLSFKQGDIIEVLDRVNNDWWRGRLHGREGLFPCNYVKKLESNEKKAPPPPMPSRNSYQGGGYATPPAQAYPPPPPPAQAYPPPPPSAQAYPPPPPPAQYPPPPSGYQPSYSQPSPSYNYAPPPAQQAPEPAGPHTESKTDKASGMLKKVAGQVGNAATWGFGGTLGSEAAHALF